MEFTQISLTPKPPSYTDSQKASKDKQPCLSIDFFRSQQLHQLLQMRTLEFGVESHLPLPKDLRHSIVGDPGFQFSCYLLISSALCLLHSFMVSHEGQEKRRDLHLAHPISHYHP